MVLSCLVWGPHSRKYSVNPSKLSIQKKQKFSSYPENISTQKYLEDAKHALKMRKITQNSIFTFFPHVFYVKLSTCVKRKIIFKNLRFLLFITIYHCEPLSQPSYLMTMLCSRFVLFISSLENSSKICIRLLIIWEILQTNATKYLNIIDKHIVKNCIIFREIPVEEEWRISFLNELISAKKQ